MDRVSKDSNLLERSRVRVETVTEPLQWGLTHQNPELCNLAGFMTKNPAFRHHKIGYNSVFEF